MRRPFLLLPLVLLLVLPGAARAITIRDDVTDTAAQTLAGDAAYASVGMFTRAGFDITSGVLINPSYVLTAGHIAVSPAGDFIFTIGGFDYTVVAYTVSPDDDLAIFQLASPVLNVTPALLYTGSSEALKTATLVGFGQGGNGTDGATSATGTKRAATNVIDALNTSQLAYDFDSGLAGDNTYGLATQSAYEGLIALGDSGGGTFATFGQQTYLIGIHAGVNKGTDTSINYSYGEIGVDVRVSSSSAQSFIQSVVPEPVSALYLASGATLLFARRRR
jgi:hypothetical protein